ncbi:inactive tyrosine-protein kinase PEAK1 [Pholidichthys leucotaenia]
MSACSTFTEHVWKPGECKNCFKPKSLHCLTQSSGGKPPSEQRPPTTQQYHPTPGGARANPNLITNSQRAARSGHLRPPVAKKPTIAVKPTMMLPCSSIGLDTDGNPQQPPSVIEQGKTSAFTVWNRNGLNRKIPGAPINNNEGEDGNDEIEGYGQLSPRTPTGNNNNSGLTDVLKEIAGLGPGSSPTPLSGSKDLFWGRISSSYRRSLERGLPASSCLAMGSSSGGGCNTAQKRVSLSDSTTIISTEGGRFCYPEFSSESDDEEEEDEDEAEDTERDEDDEEEEEHESWDESDEELLAMEIRMRGQPRFANFRAATLSPVPFAAGKKWNTVPLRNRSLQRICAVDYDDSYDEILNGYPTMDSNGGILSYGPADMQGSGFLSNSESATSPESSSSVPEDSRTTPSSESSANCVLRNGLHSPTFCKIPATCTTPPKKEPVTRALSPLKVSETHKAVLAIRLEEQDGREGMPMPQALPGQPVTISFSPTEEQAKPYRVVNLEKSMICKPYTVVDVSASMAHKDEEIPASSPKPKNQSMPSSPTSFSNMPSVQLLSPTSPVSLSSSVMPTSPTSVPLAYRKKTGNIRYQEVWTSSTSPRQKIPKVDLGVGSNAGPALTTQHFSHKSAPTSPISGLSSSRTVPVKSPNLSEIKFNSFNNAGMPPFPIIIRDEPAYARSSKNAVKVPIVINPSAYDNLAVYKSFLGLSGELPQAKGVGNRVASHTYEEIGSSESVQSSSTEKTVSARGTSERVSFEEIRLPLEAMSKAPTLQPRTTTETCTVTTTVISSRGGALSPTVLTNSSAKLAITANLPKTSSTANACKTSIDATCRKDADTGLPLSSGSVESHREEASAVLSQIVASIQPPHSPPESPSVQAQTFSSEELYALPPDATKETLIRPKSLFSPMDGCLSKPKKDTPSKVLSKSQSASAAVPLSSPRSETSAPFPPPRSTSSPYHASNIIQRHFGNWTKSSASSSPLRPSEGEGSPGGEGRRISTENSKPKRWISFKSFFRRRKDEDEQKEKVERDKEKSKLVGLDGTVIHVLPPPPTQQQHWFTEAKPEDPTQKPTIIFTYKPGSSSNTGDIEELRVEECRETTVITPDESKKPLSPGTTPSSHTAEEALITKDTSQVPGSASSARDQELPSATSLPAKVNLGLVFGDSKESHANRVATPAPAPALAPASEGTASIGEHEEDGIHSHYSLSPASSHCSATYSNLGQSRANMIPQKHPRSTKASNDTLTSIELDGLVEQPTPKCTPPPLPKKAVPRSITEPTLGGKEPIQGAHRPRAEAKPGGTNLSVANPLYDLDSTWETASQSSSLSSEPHRVHDHESGDSLERMSATTANKSRLTNSVSSLVPQPAPAATAATTGRERRVYPSTESLAGRGRSAGRGTGGGSKPQRPALYRGLDSWDEVVGRIRGLHTDTLRKLSTKCEDRFMAGQKDHLRFGTDSWSHFRLTTGKPCCEAGDAVYYTASYAKDPLVNYAIKICRSQVKETQQQFFHSLAVRQSLPVHFNIQQDCGYFLADVPARLLPWEEDNEEEEEDVKEQKEELTDKEEEVKMDTKIPDSQATNSKPDEPPTATHMNTVGHLRSRVVVITREVPFQTVADFVREGTARHTHNPELYERQVCLLLLQLCSGLEHMKPYHVTHCDLRLENLLLVQCQPGNPWNLDLTEPNNNSNSSSSGATSASAAAANATCPARLIISNFSQAKQKSTTTDPGTLRDQSRLAPEIITATQYRKCDEFQTGILIYEMLHRPNPFEETPDLKEREYTWADLPPLPVRSLYSQGLQQLARLLLTVNPSERIRMSEARACLQCLLWGPREDLFQALGCSSMGPMSAATSSQREATLQNWLDLKRTLMMIKFAERSLDTACGVSLEDWLCCQYLAFATTDSLSRVVHILQQPQQHPPSQNQPVHSAQNQTQIHLAHTLHLTPSQPL